MPWKNLQRKGNSSPGGILIRCPNHLDWLVLTQRSSSSNSELPPDVSATYPISTGAVRSCFWLTGSWMFALTLFSAAVSCVYQGNWFSVDQTETRKQSQDLFASSAQLRTQLPWDAVLWFQLRVFINQSKLPFFCSEFSILSSPKLRKREQFLTFFSPSFFSTTTR